jgi:hypothetical protein
LPARLAGLTARGRRGTHQRGVLGQHQHVVQGQAQRLADGRLEAGKGELLGHRDPLQAIPAGLEHAVSAAPATLPSLRKTATPTHLERSLITGIEEDLRLHCTSRSALKLEGGVLLADRLGGGGTLDLP